MVKKEKVLLNLAKKEITAFNLAVTGPYVLVDVLDIEEKKDSGIIIPETLIFKSTDITSFDSGKDKEKGAYMLYESSPEHPFQAVIIGIGPIAEKEYGLKVGDIIYGGIGVRLTRSVVTINNAYYGLINLSSIFCVVGHVDLRVVEIKSKNL